MAYYKVVATGSREDVRLSVEDVKALRQADQIVFHHNGDDAAMTRVRAIREIKDRNFDVFSGGRLEAERLIPVESIIETYGADGERQPYRFCFDMIHAAQYSKVWRTIVAAIKPGDIVCLVWSVAGGERDDTYLSQNGLFMDELEVVIRRADKAGNVKDAGTYMLSAHVTPDNTARMIKRNHM